MAEKKGAEPTERMLSAVISLIMMVFMIQILMQVLQQMQQAFAEIIPPTEGAPPTGVLLEDDFNDNSIDPAKWVAVPGIDGTVVETNQRLEITRTAEGDSYLESAELHNISKATVKVDVVKRDTNIEAWLLLNVEGETDNGYRMSKTPDGNLVIHRYVGGVETNLFTGAYEGSTGEFKVVIDNGTISFYENGVLKFSEDYYFASKNVKFWLRGRTAVSGTQMVAFDNFSAKVT
ncbi:hypothetical protein DRO59_00565 [Candidatus Bathyarchaeota archaeon]|nr:MAG: hypothetical protein DRO59_00565 [Candidatus Bathyarchaeota archaeon]